MESVSLSQKSIFRLGVEWDSQKLCGFAFKYSYRQAHKEVEMSLTASQRSLIGQLESCEWLSDRYKELRCINAGQEIDRRGVISLVFCAYDSVENKLVAVKFMDPERLHDLYRVSAFDRETEILKKLSVRKRCLQLIESDQLFDWRLFSEQENPESIRIKAKFFVTEWIPDDIDDYFLKQTEWSALEKLNIFRKILLAVESIHSESIHHRDLKPDNIRSCQRSGEQTLVVIDFGTAAHLNTERLISQYEWSVGAPAYAAPETFCGLGGIREIGHLTDIYALGCMLFEMFNRELYAKERVKNQYFEKVMSALRFKLEKVPLESKMAAWENEVKAFNHMVEPARIAQAGHTIPASIEGILSDLHSRMVQFDFRHRYQNIREIRLKIDSAIALLKNKRKEELVIRERTKYRQNRLRKIYERMRKLEAYLAAKGGKIC